MPFLLVFGLVIIQSTSPWFKTLVKKQPLSVSEKRNSRRDENCSFLQWLEKGNSSGNENYCLLCSSEKSSSRILSRVTENWAILVVNGEKQFSSRRELLDSLREFSNSRRNLDENCWIRGENLQILVSPTICRSARVWRGKERGAVLPRDCPSPPVQALSSISALICKSESALFSWMCANVTKSVLFVLCYISCLSIDLLEQISSPLYPRASSIKTKFGVKFEIHIHLLLLIWLQTRLFWRQFWSTGCQGDYKVEVYVASNWTSLKLSPKFWYILSW